MRYAILLLLLVAACTPPTPGTTDFNSGREGVELSFEGDTVPDEAFEGSQIPIRVRLWNKGAYPLRFDELIFSLKGESFYMGIIDDPELERRAKASVFVTGYDDEHYLDGKGPYFQNGEWLDLQPTLKFNLIQGPRQQPNTEIFASVCYPYTTQFSSEICVDANSFNGNQQEQVCAAQVLTFQDQGAPVAITRIENQPAAVYSPDLEQVIVRPTFIIHVRNVGQGLVLRNLTTSKEEQLDACNFRASTSELNRVSITARLSNLTLDCSPAEIPMLNNEGFTTCSLPLSEVGNLAATPNYLAAFSVELGYLYRDSISQSIDIVRLDPSVRAGTVPTAPLNDPSTINGESACSYCSTRPDDPQCAGWPAAELPNGTYACNCGERECRDLENDYRRGKGERRCVYGTWCPGTALCCTT